MASNPRLPAINKPKGKVSTKAPQRSRETVCITRQPRSVRRAYSTEDLRRIYRYVIGSAGWRKATCAILDESGIQGYLDDTTALVASAAPCAEAIDLSAISDWLPDDLDEQLGIPDGTIEAALGGCSSEDEGGAKVGTTLRVVLGLLLVLWGLWKKVSVSRFYRFILRRFLLTTALVIALDRLGDFLARAIPLILLIGDALDQLTEVCDDDNEER